MWRSPSYFWILVKGKVGLVMWLEELESKYQGLGLKFLLDERPNAEKSRNYHLLDYFRSNSRLTRIRVTQRANWDIVNGFRFLWMLNGKIFDEMPCFLRVITKIFSTIGGHVTKFNATIALNISIISATFISPLSSLENEIGVEFQTFYSKPTCILSLCSSFEKLSYKTIQ